MQAFNPLAVDPQATAEARKVLRLLAIAYAFLYFGFNTWSSMFNNFAVDVLALRPDQVGMIQSARELPGLVGLVVGYIVLFLPEVRLVGVCLLLLGAGLMMSGRSTSYSMFLVASTIASTGFHFFDCCGVSLALGFTRKIHAPRVLGSLNAIGAAASVAGTLAVFLLAKPLGYRALFYLVGGLALAGGLVVSALGNQAGTHEAPRRATFRRRYWLYYLLTLLMGARRHMFTTFAILLLISEHGVTVQQSAILFLVNSVVTTYTYGRIGRLVSRFGERQTLTVNFVLLALVFVGYAYVHWVWALVLLFVADNILFGFSLAINTYFQKIAASPEEITSNVSLGQTVNHVAAIFMPWLGGLIWAVYGYQATFMLGVGIVLVGLVVVQWLRVPALAAAGRA